MNSNFNQILKKYDVTQCEYNTMSCPYYGSYMPAKQMASVTVLNVMGGTEDVYTADDYLIAINAMIDKGWFKIATEEDCRNDRKNNSYPTFDELIGPPSSVIFTKKGYFLHRNILIEKLGQKFIDSVDSFDVVDKKKREISFYAQTKEVCEDWLFSVQQHTTELGISYYADGPAEIINISKPKSIGKWSPSIYLTHDKGYECKVFYKRFNKRKYNITDLKLNSIISIFTPIYIYGSIGDEEFSFSDRVNWQPAKGEKCSDKNAHFHWFFCVDGQLKKNIPEKSHLKGEKPNQRGFIVPNYLFELKENARRRNMLSIYEAKEILKQCVIKYLNQ